MPVIRYVPSMANIQSEYSLDLKADLKKVRLKQPEGQGPAGAIPITLGHRILRTETAGLTMLSILMFELEED